MTGLRRRRGPRRVIAPPTNPSADQSDDVPAQAPGTRRGDGRDRGPVERERGSTGSDRGSVERERGSTGSEPTDPRDAWILAERPPHWD